MKKIINLKLPGQGAAGRYKIAIVDSKTGKEVWRQPEWKHNLILNNGLNQVAGTPWVSCFSYATAGTGTYANSVASGDTTASQSGTIVTLVGGSFVFTSGDVGNYIKWNTTNEEARIVSFTSATQVTVHVNQTVGAGAFVLHRTNQTGLATEVKRTAAYLVGAGNCGSTITAASGLVSHRRTFDFTVEAAQVTYTELGMAWASSGANTHFSRMVLDAPVTVYANQQLRVVYELQIQMTPYTATAKTANITGWPVSPATSTNGYESILKPGLAGIVTATGAIEESSVGLLGGWGNEPCQGGSGIYGTQMEVSTTSTALTAFNSSPPAYNAGKITGKALTLSAYTALSFTLDKFVTFSTSEGNSTAIRSIALYSWGYDYAFIFDQAQTKTNTQTLKLTLRYTWGRILPTVA